MLTPAEIIRSATVVGAELCQMTGQIGTIAKGAFADLVVVDGDPPADIALLQGDGAHMPVIMAGGAGGEGGGLGMSASGPKRIIRLRRKPLDCGRSSGRR